MSPCFLTKDDLAAGAATDEQLLFGLTTWISGQKSVAPEGVSISSYDVVDRLVEHYLNTTTYPKLEVCLLHSMDLRGSNFDSRTWLLRDTAQEHRWLSAMRPYASPHQGTTEFITVGLIHFSRRQYLTSV